MSNLSCFRHVFSGLKQLFFARFSPIFALFHVVLNPINQFALFSVDVVVVDVVAVVLTVSVPCGEVKIEDTFAVVVGGLVVLGRWGFELSVEEVEDVHSPASLDTCFPPVS